VSVSKRNFSEWVRILLLGLVASWLLHPFATNRLIGAGDAYWYANMLADFVAQLRAGVFPVFVGQTEYAFNGAVFPLRVAPLYQHLGGLIDLVTGHSLGFYMLQHLTVIVCGVAGIYSAYFVLCRIAPYRRWSAAGLSILFLSCPGVLATIYTQDQYMTWMTVPIAPWAVYGIVRTFRKDDLVSQLCLVAPLAALWWAHSPIALWFTAIAVGSQLLRLARVHRGLVPLNRSILGAILFALLAQYPFVSVYELRSPGQTSSVVGSLPRSDMIMEGIRNSFPADLLPLSAHARLLSDLQLGYGLWTVLAITVALSLVERSALLWGLLASSAGLLILLLPVPGVTAFLWSHFPGALVRITYYWPMQRFYLILAVLIAVAAQVALSSERRVHGLRRSAAGAVIVAGCLWSLWQTRQFIVAGAERTASQALSDRSERPENRPLMTHAYGLFAALPSRFTNGVADPVFESRFLDSATCQPLPEPRRKLVASGPLEGTVDANPGILDLAPVIRLEPGRHYELRFAFAKASLKGILQLSGTSFFREYSLPTSGEKASFGSGPMNSKSIGVGSTDPTGDSITVRFIPTMLGVSPADLGHFGSFELYESDPAVEPVRMVSFVPYEAQVTVPVPATLETPRMFIPGYVATVDGETTSAGISKDGLVTIPVSIGTHAVGLRFKGPVALRLSYWSAAFAWVALLIWASASALFPRGLSAPSQ